MSCGIPVEFECGMKGGNILRCKNDAWYEHVYVKQALRHYGISKLRCTYVKADSFDMAIGIWDLSGIKELVRVRKLDGMYPFWEIRSGTPEKRELLRVSYRSRGEAVFSFNGLTGELYVTTLDGRHTDLLWTQRLRGRVFPSKLHWSIYTSYDCAAVRVEDLPCEILWTGTYAGTLLRLKQKRSKLRATIDKDAGTRAPHTLDKDAGTRVPTSEGTRYQLLGPKDSAPLLSTSTVESNSGNSVKFVNFLVIGAPFWVLRAVIRYLE